MSDHIDVMKRAIEFGRPAYVPMEIVDVPGVYNAYHTLDPDTVEFIPGTEDFDALWPCCYSWLHEVIGRTEQGEPIKWDQFGVRLKTPADHGSVYTLLEHPLAGRSSLEGLEWPDPDDADPHFGRLGRVIRDRYPDRFVDGFVDAGIFLTAEFLVGMEEFLYKVAAEPDFAVELYGRVEEYYRRLIPKFKRAGAHMITLIEDIGGTSSLVMNPETWRKLFKPITTRFLKAVHEAGLYAGLCIDGHSGDVLDDLKGMGVDCFTVVDNGTVGLDLLRRKLRGKLCVKAAVDMQRTLARGTPEAVEKEAADLVENLHTREGGFISQIVRWHRPEYPAANVAASVRAFNRYRR
jgi:uroporphyrinogen decarboxylase